MIAGAATRDTPSPKEAAARDHVTRQCTGQAPFCGSLWRRPPLATRRGRETGESGAASNSVPLSLNGGALRVGIWSVDRECRISTAQAKIIRPASFPENAPRVFVVQFVSDAFVGEADKLREWRVWPTIAAQ
jgi:hypothetical protein